MQHHHEPSPVTQRVESSTPNPPARSVNRYIRILHLFNLITNSEPNTNAAAATTPAPSTSSSSPECYACTQPGPLTFHSSASCGSHPPSYVSTAGSSLLPIQNTPTFRPVARNPTSSSVLDPRSKRVQNWNRLVLFARAAALIVDPLFFYTLSVGRDGVPCLVMYGRVAAALAGVRTCVDMVHVADVGVQLRVAYVSRESLMVGWGKLVWDPKMIVQHYLMSPKWFWFDVFVILPLPQVRVERGKDTVPCEKCLMKKLNKWVK